MRESDTIDTVAEKRKRKSKDVVALIASAPGPEKPPELPDFLQMAPVLAKRKLRRNGLSKYQEQLHQAYAPALLPLYYRQLYELLSKGDKEAMRIMGDLYNLVQSRGGVNVTTQLFNANMNGQNSPVTMDSIIRRLSDKQSLVVEAEPVDGTLAS